MRIRFGWDLYTSCRLARSQVLVKLVVELILPIEELLQLLVHALTELGIRVPIRALRHAVDIEAEGTTSRYLIEDLRCVVQIRHFDERVDVRDGSLCRGEVRTRHVPKRNGIGDVRAQHETDQGVVEGPQ